MHMAHADLILPFGACFIAVVGALAGTLRKSRSRQAELLAKGLSASEMERILTPSTPYLLRAGYTLSLIGFSLTLFFSVLSRIGQHPEFMVAAAVCIIPLLIGLEFFLDARLRMHTLQSLRRTN